MKPKQILLAAASTGLTFALCLPVIVHSMKSNAVPIGTIHTDKAALYGWALPPSTDLTLTSPDTKQKIHYRTNSQGWKDVEHSFEKRKKRILVIGDSFTFSITRIEDQYSRVLERMLGSDYEVISIGIGGWGTDQELTAYENEGRLYRPDIVVLQFYKNDVDNNIAPAGKNGGIVHNGMYWRKPFRFFLQDGELQKYKIAKGNTLPDFNDGDGWGLTSKILIRFKEIVEDNRSQFAVINPAAQSSDVFSMKLRSLCSEQHIVIVPARYRAYELYRTDMHLTALGNKQMAEDIARFIK